MSHAAPDSASSVNKPALRDRSQQLVSLNLVPELELTEARTTLPLQLEITVRYGTGAYNTNQVFGFRSSSTMAAREAALAQARKVFGDWEPVEMAERPGGHPMQYVFRLSGNLPIAWCWASGIVQVGRVMPPDAMPIAAGPAFNLFKELDVACRHGKGASAGMLLVPGVPEAPYQQDGLRALRAFIQWRAHTGNAAKALRRLGITYAAYPGSAS